MLQRPFESTLRTLIAMMDDVGRPALDDRHVQGGQHQLCCHLLADRPPDDAPTPHIEHDREEDETSPRWHVGEVGHPQLVRTLSDEAPVNKIWRRTLLRIALCRHTKGSTSTHASDVRLPHQARYALASDARAFVT